MRSAPCQPDRQRISKLTAPERDDFSSNRHLLRRLELLFVHVLIGKPVIKSGSGFFRIVRQTVIQFN
jgi:hypothetical protein